MRIGDWTLKEIAQGKPWAHPTHAMFVHFPTALYPAALLFGVISRLRGSAPMADAATLLLGLGILATIPAALTGLIDWWAMVPGSTKRNVATRHMLLQAAGLVLAALGFASLVFDGDGPAPAPPLVVIGVAVGVLFVGNWLGGVLVYRMAMRVGGTRLPAHPRPGS